MITTLILSLIAGVYLSCGFNSTQSIPKYKLDDPKGNLRLLDTHDYQPLRIYFDYTTLDQQTDIAEDIRNNIKLILQNTKYIYESLIQVKPLTFPIKLHDCDSRVTISKDLKNNGVDADLVIFPFIDPETEDGTEAYGASCVLATRNNRPVAGIIAFSQGLSKYRENWMQFYTGLAFHELAHVLLFNPFLYDLFIDETGNQIPSEKVYKTMVINGLSRKMIITPKVVETAQRHFGCNNITGVELENQGGQGTENSHWEARVMLSDLMIGFTYDEATLSEITLAFFEDSGWYKANYYTGGLFRYGKSEGCGFVSSKCTSSVNSYSNEFCSKSKPYSSMCTAGHMSRAVCYITDKYNNIDPNYRYFSGAANVGGLELPDYCPVAAAPTNMTNYMPYNCVSGLYRAPSELKEKIGEESRCFMSSLVENDLYNRLPISYKSSNALCYEHKCDFVNRVLTVKVGELSLQCPYEGGDVTAEGYYGSLKCPAFENLCTGDAPCDNLIDCVNKKVLPIYLDTRYNLTVPYVPPILVDNSTDNNSTNTNDTATLNTNSTSTPILTPNSTNTNSHTPPHPIITNTPATPIVNHNTTHEATFLDPPNPYEVPNTPDLNIDFQSGSRFHLSLFIVTLFLIFLN
jgi:hypothetical protein